MAGLTNTGFEPKTNSEIITDIGNALLSAFPDIDISASSLNGQYIGVSSLPPTELWELAEKVYLSFSPSNAEGVSLDYILALNGLSRLSALPSVVPVGFNGTPGTVIPQGTQIKNPTTDDIFITNAEFTLSTTSVNKAYFEITALRTSPSYVISLNITGSFGVSVTVDPSSFSTIEQVVDKFVADIPTFLPDIIATKTNSSAFMIQPVDASDFIDYDTLGDADIRDYNEILCTSSESGEIPVVQDTINVIETPVVGLSNVNNFETGTLGRNTETDADARIRREESLGVIGSGGTLIAITSRLVDEIDGVETATGFQNDDDVVDGEGRPAHSIEILISGTDTPDVDQEVADLLYEIKGHGIQTYGNISKTTVDLNGNSQTVKFSRATEKYLHLDIEIELNPESTFPVDGVNDIKDSIVAFGATFEAGQDVLRDQLYCPIFAINGIKTITKLEMDVTDNPGDSPTFANVDSIAIGSTEIAKFNQTRITINVL